MKSLKYFFSIAALTGVLTLSASATFMIDPDPGGAKLFIDNANKNVSDFEGFVGANNSSAPHVDIHTTGNVNTGSGFATIKPIKNGSLTELVFTPEDPNLFSDFSFRGQLLADADGIVNLSVTDNLGITQTFTFTGLGSNADFARQGIISLDGETIQSVTLTSDFKEVKQIEFSGAGVVVPDSGATAMLLGCALAGLMVARRYLKR